MAETGLAPVKRLNAETVGDFSANRFITQLSQRISQDTNDMIRGNLNNPNNIVNRALNDNARKVDQIIATTTAIHADTIYIRKVVRKIEKGELGIGGTPGFLDNAMNWITGGAAAAAAMRALKFLKPGGATVGAAFLAYEIARLAAKRAGATDEDMDNKMSYLFSGNQNKTTEKTSIKNAVKRNLNRLGLIQAAPKIPFKISAINNSRQAIERAILNDTRGAMNALGENARVAIKGTEFKYLGSYIIMAGIAARNAYRSVWEIDPERDPVKDPTRTSKIIDEVIQTLDAVPKAQNVNRQSQTSQTQPTAAGTVRTPAQAQQTQSMSQSSSASPMPAPSVGASTPSASTAATTSPNTTAAAPAQAAQTTTPSPSAAPNSAERPKTFTAPKSRAEEPIKPQDLSKPQSRGEVQGGAAPAAPRPQPKPVVPGAVSPPQPTPSAPAPVVSAPSTVPTLPTRPDPVAPRAPEPRVPDIPQLDPGPSGSAPSQPQHQQSQSPSQSPSPAAPQQQQQTPSATQPQQGPGQTGSAPNVKIKPGGGAAAPENLQPGGTNKQGQYRPVYPLGDADTSDAVVNTIAGEAIVSDPRSVDGVINNMMNRVGLDPSTYGPSGNLRDVARAYDSQGHQQYAGYRQASKKEADFIRGRIRAIASGNEPDITHGSNEYRASSYTHTPSGGRSPWYEAHKDAPVIGGNRFAYNSKAGAGTYAPFEINPPAAGANAQAPTDAGSKLSAIQNGDSTQANERNARGLIPEFGNRVDKMIADAAKAGHKVFYNSAGRTPEYQAQLIQKQLSKGDAATFQQYVQKEGAIRGAAHWANDNPDAAKRRGIGHSIALPGRSNHQRGSAADLGFGDKAAEKWVHDHTQDYNLRFRMGYEPWHIEPAEGGREFAEAYQKKLQDERQKTAQQNAPTMDPLTGKQSQAAPVPPSPQQDADAQKDQPESDPSTVLNNPKHPLHRPENLTPATPTPPQGEDPATKAPETPQQGLDTIQQTRPQAKVGPDPTPEEKKYRVTPGYMARNYIEKGQADTHKATDDLGMNSDGFKPVDKIPEEQKRKINMDPKTKAADLKQSELDLLRKKSGGKFDWGFGVQAMAHGGEFETSGPTLVPSKKGPVLMGEAGTEKVTVQPNEKLPHHSRLAPAARPESLPVSQSSTEPHMAQDGTPLGFRDPVRPTTSNSPTRSQHPRPPMSYLLANDLRNHKGFVGNVADYGLSGLTNLAPDQR
jgi:hypothetical protein